MEIDLLFILICGVLTLVMLIIGVTVFVHKYRLSRLEYARKAEEQERKWHRELLHAELEIGESSMLHASRQIQDVMEQNLKMARQLISTLEHDSAPVEKAKAVDHLLERSLSDLREVSRSLNANYIRALGLFGALKHEILLWEKKKVEPDLCFENYQPGVIDSDRELLLFRNIQELIQHCARECSAKRIHISLSTSESKVFCSVEHNGAVLSQESLQRNALLEKLKQRMTIMEGWMEYAINGNNATKITMVVPPGLRVGPLEKS